MRDLVVWWQSPAANGNIHYAYYHRNAALAVAALPASPEQMGYKMLDAADVLNKILLFSLAIVIIAKGRNPRLAYPAGLFLYGMAAGSGIISTLVGLPWWMIVLVQTLRQVLLAVSLYALLFLSAELAKHAYSEAVRRGLNVAGAFFVFAIILPLLIVGAIAYPLQVYAPMDTFLRFFYGLPVIAKIIPLLIMAYGIARENADDVVLLRWIFASTLMGFSGPLVKETSSALRAGDPRFGALVLTESVMAFGYGYALIRSRLVDINFVLNRAAVLAVLAGIIAIGFQLGNSLLEAKYEHASAVAYVLVLIIGISLNYLRPKLESLFRHLGSAHRINFEQGLSGLLRDCRRMKSVDDIMTVSVNQLCHLANVRACALYDRQKGQFVRVALEEAAPAPAAFPSLLSDDDQVVLRIAETGRACDAVSAVTAYVTALPPSSTSFPMMVSDELIGAIVLDPAAEQQLRDPDMRKDVCAFARELGNILAFKRSHYAEADPSSVNRLSPA